MPDSKTTQADVPMAVWEYAHDAEDKRMPLEELSKTLEFGALTKKQKLCIATYISNGYDIVNAIRTAYNCRGDDIATIMQHRFFSSYSVTMVLIRHFGSNPKQEFLIRLVKGIIKGNLTNNQIRAYELYARVQEWDKNPLLEAAKIAQELGYKVLGEGKKGTNKVTTENLKADITSVIKRTKDKLPKEDKDEFDLSDFKDKVGSK